MRPVSRRLTAALGGAALLAVGFLLGHAQSRPLAAQPPAPAPTPGVTPAAATAPAAADKRVIAYVNGNQAITREEFGEYLIQMFGQDRVRLYVNRRIIEAAGARRGIVVTPQEVEAVIESDCGKLGVNKQQFIDTVLKQKYGKSIHEWRDDVIRPRLILQAMCKDRLKIDDAELKKVYENVYGEKVQCQIILWPQDQKKDVLRMYDSLSREDGVAFNDAARGQLSSDLRARLGMVDPIGRHSGPGTAKIEEIAFRLKDGQVSEVIDTGGGIMLIKRIKSIPAQAGVTFPAVREALVKELTDRQMDQEVPKMFAQLSEEAKPLFVLAPADVTTKEMEDKSKRLLGADPTPLEKK